MADGPHMKAAKAVADLLNGTWPAAVERPAGIAFTAEVKRFPKFKQDGSDLANLTVVVVPATPFTITVENRGAVNRECPVNVVIAQKVDRLDVARQETLAAFVDATAELLASRPLADPFGYPDGDEGVEAEWDPDELDENGLFFAVVGAVYGTTEDGEDE